MTSLEFRDSPPVADLELNALFEACWPEHRERPFGRVLARSVSYVCAYDGGRLVGFVNVAGDGGEHAFVLDTTVHPDYQRRGVGLELVRRAAQLARSRGAAWLHVDFVPDLEPFYRRAGFGPTTAGLMDLTTLTP